MLPESSAAQDGTAVEHRLSVDRGCIEIEMSSDRTRGHAESAAEKPPRADGACRCQCGAKKRTTAKCRSPDSKGRDTELETGLGVQNALAIAFEQEVAVAGNVREEIV